MPTPEPNNPQNPTNAPTDPNPTNAPTNPNPTNAPQDSGAPTPQTRGQNPDNSHENAEQGVGTTTTPDNATQRGGYAGAAQGPYDNRDGSPRPEGGGQSDPAATNASNDTGDRDGYTNEQARNGSAEQGTGSRGGSYNDQNANAPHATGAGRNADDSQSTTGAASGLVNTGPDQQRTEQKTSGDADRDVDSGGASTGRAPDTSERV